MLIASLTGVDPILLLFAHPHGLSNITGIAAHFVVIFFSGNAIAPGRSGFATREGNAVAHAFGDGLLRIGNVG